MAKRFPFLAPIFMTVIVLNLKPKRKDTVSTVKLFQWTFVYIFNRSYFVEDNFAIDEVTLFDGDWNEKKYAVAGDILDGYLYDLFMNMLDERGINANFADKLSEYCSSYEHSQYINLLEELQRFVK